MSETEGPEAPASPAVRLRLAYEAFVQTLHEVGGTAPGDLRGARFGARLLAEAHTHAETARLYAEEYIRQAPAA